MPDATPLLNEIIGGLENLASQIVAQIGDDRTYAEMWGWNLPSINRNDFAAIVRSPQAVIRSLISNGLTNLEDTTYAKLLPAPTRITYLITTVLPNLPSGNAGNAYIAIKSFIDYILNALNPLVGHGFDFQEIADRNLLPAAQIKRLQSVDRGINTLIGNAATFENRVSFINEAHSVAEALPTDMRMLEDARKSVKEALLASQTNQAGTETARSKVEGIVSEVEILKDQAIKLVENTQGAFGAATTKGLGEEFGNKAAQLAKSVWQLGLILAITLLIGGIITYLRLSHINSLITNANLNSQTLWANVLLSVVSVAGPIWFSWLVTKQIGQRFRLSEDYAFKAAVAKAYAGYSQEAARVDPEFQKMLYKTALARIDEEPLRYVEMDNHGSPLHELWSKRSFRKAVMKYLDPSPTAEPASSSDMEN